jgi:dUTP pyrophosphatase
MIKFEVVLDKYRKNINSVKLPQRATACSAGYDFYAPYDFVVEPKSEYFIWTDIKVKMPSDMVFEVIGRSSFGIKRNIFFKNLIAKIDADYYNNLGNDGNIGLCFYNNGDTSQEIKEGEAFCQGTFFKYFITDDDCPVQIERTGGIGSTGVK